MEEELCREMEQVYELYMRDREENAFIQKCRDGSSPLGLSFAINRQKNEVIVAFTCDGKIEEVITSFPARLAHKDRENLKKECTLVGIIATETLDRIYGRKGQPLMKIKASFDLGSGLAKEIWKVVNYEK